MHEDEVLHSEVSSTLTRLKSQHQELKKSLEKAYGYAVFPSVGRASVVVGGAPGKGEVYEQGEHIGNAKLRQLTVGVQVGGQTFSELLLFQSKESMKDFKRSPVKFTANASAVAVKAGVSGTTDFSGVTAMAFKEGGELLEASLGGQKFTYEGPPGEEAQGALPSPGEEEEEKKKEEEKGPGLASRIASRFGRGKRSGGEEEGEEGEQAKPGEQPRQEANEGEARQPHAPQE